MSGIQNKITSILQTFLLVMFTVCALDICGNSFGRDFSVNLRSLDLLMPEQPLNCCNSQTVLDEQSGKCVARCMECIMFRYTYLLQDFSQSLVCRGIASNLCHQLFNGSITFNNRGCFASKNIIQWDINHKACFNHLFVDPLFGNVFTPECHQVRETQSGIASKQE